MKLQRVIIFWVSLLPFWCGVLGGQVPVVDGVCGGISSTPSSARRTVFQQKNSKPSNSSNTTPGKIRVVENSRICGRLLPFCTYHIVIFLETTPGVYQASGYGDLTETKSIWCNYFIPLRSVFVTYLLQVLVFCLTQKS
jgi:hypothetical protein